MRASRPHPAPAPSSTTPRWRGPPRLPAAVDQLSERWWSLHPRTRAIAVGVAVALVVALAGARGLSAPYGPERDVLVAATDLPAGTELDDADAVTLARWPDQLIPPDASLERSGRLRASLPAGTVLTEGHRSPGGLGDQAGPGRAAVPLPLEALPTLEVGARVQVVGAEVDGAARVLADSATVLATDDEATWLAVDAETAADVAAAGLRGAVTVTVLPR